MSSFATIPAVVHRRARVPSQAGVDAGRSVEQNRLQCHVAPSPSRRHRACRCLTSCPRSRRRGRGTDVSNLRPRILGSLDVPPVHPLRATRGTIDAPDRREMAMSTTPPIDPTDPRPHGRPAHPGVPARGSAAHRGVPARTARAASPVRTGAAGALRAGTVRTGALRAGAGVRARSGRPRYAEQGHRVDRPQPRHRRHRAQPHRTHPRRMGGPDRRDHRRPRPARRVRLRDRGPGGQRNGGKPLSITALVLSVVARPSARSP